MAVVLIIKVVPQSGRQQFVWCEKQQLLKCFLKSAPERNKANEELCTFLRKTLGIPHSAIAIVAGHTGRRKKISIQTEQSVDAILAACGVQRQQSVV